MNEYWYVQYTLNNNYQVQVQEWKGVHFSTHSSSAGIYSILYHSSAFSPTTPPSAWTTSPSSHLTHLFTACALLPSPSFAPATPYSPPSTACSPPLVNASVWLGAFRPLFVRTLWRCRCWVFLRFSCHWFWVFWWIFGWRFRWGCRVWRWFTCWDCWECGVR